MKKLPLLLIIALASIQGYSQLTLEGSYSHSGTMVEIEDNVFKYFMMDVPNNQCAISNEDHTSYKNISLSIPSGYFLYDVKFLSTYLFNTDAKLELLYVYAKYELIGEEYITVYGMKVVNEDGSVLLTLADGGFAEIKEGSEGPKLLIYQYVWNSTYYLINTKVYEIGGTTKAAERFSKESMLLYPNPSYENINFRAPTAMPKAAFVTNMKGSIVINETDFDSASEISISTSQLQPGIYTLSILGADGSIITEKFEKK